MNLEKIFEIFGKKIFYTIAVCYWLVFFLGEKLGFQLSEISNDGYRQSIVGCGLFSSCFAIIDLIIHFGRAVKKVFEYSYVEKERKEYYLKAIKTIQRYGDVDGLGILLSLLSFPSRGDHWQKGIPQSQKNDVYAILQLFSEVTVGKNYRKVLTFYSNLDHFDFDEGFFEFLEEYFEKNKHQKVDLLSNFIISK